MDSRSLHENTDYSVTFFAGDHLVCGLVVRKLDSHTLDVSLFRDTGEQIEIALDILEACWTVLSSQSRLAGLERAYPELGESEEAYTERAEGENPPALSSDDIPF